jgi:hypothetical protein
VVELIMLISKIYIFFPVKRVKTQWPLQKFKGWICAMNNFSGIFVGISP